MVNDLNKQKRTSQSMDNLSFHEGYNNNTQLILGEDKAAGKLYPIAVNPDGSLIVDHKETLDAEGNGIVSVGVTAVEIPFTGTTQSINIESVMGNSGTLYIGKSDVTNLGANALTSLQPGASVQMDFNDTTNALFVVSDTAAQSFIAGCLL